MASSSTSKLAVAALSTTAHQQCPKSGPAALLFLHGLGDTPAGWSQLQFSLPILQPRLRDLKFVFPAAPTTAITINGGMEMPGWFDLYDWPIGVGSRDDKVGITTSVQQMQRAIQQVTEQHGIPRSRIVVGGFSQGGAIALHVAYGTLLSSNEEQEPLAGCVALSGWLTLPDEAKVPERLAKSTPLFWGHGEDDDKVLFEQQAFGVETLVAQGVDVTSASYPMGHASHPEEMQAMADFLDTLLYGADA